MATAQQFLIKMLFMLLNSMYLWPPYDGIMLYSNHWDFTIENIVYGIIQFIQFCMALAYAIFFFNRSKGIYWLLIIIIIS